ncbi:MAG: type II toxin-antitoxin system PemK/MazF family toxin [Candidatus Promineofilum sp.]|nr:type II toxin-antitoxin system PemK/MazF family toxin [Promineifilum sp.]
MPSFSRHEVVLVRYPFSDFSAGKVRPAIIVSVEHSSEDLIIVALTSRRERLLPGEFLLKGWQAAGLNVPTVVKRGVYTVSGSLIARVIGSVAPEDQASLDNSLRLWLGL